MVRPGDDDGPCCALSLSKSLRIKVDRAKRCCGIDQPGPVHARPPDSRRQRATLTTSPRFPSRNKCHHAPSSRLEEPSLSVTSNFGAKPCSSACTSAEVPPGYLADAERACRGPLPRGRRSPQVHSLPGDPDDHLVKVPSRARAWAALPQFGRDQRAEFQHPAPHRFI